MNSLFINKPQKSKSKSNSMMVQPSRQSSRTINKINKFNSSNIRLVFMRKGRSPSKNSYTRQARYRSRNHSKNSRSFSRSKSLEI